jgi:aspartate-semialdehyde dehydrogenase
MQLMVVFKPLLDAFGINRVVVSTYQSVTGTGKRAIDQLEAERRGGTDLGVYPCPIDKNVIPHCDAFLENGYTREEMKVVWESRKILHQPDLRITCTAVRVPVVGGHSESVNVELGRDFQLDEVREVLATAPGLVVLDNPSDALYPTPRLAQGRNDVLVGRIRRDESNSNSLNLWVVADNLRKGAATNAVQIAHGLLQHGLLSNAKPAGVPLS